MIDFGTITLDTDTERINTLRKYNILDTPPDGSFDDITRLAADLLNVPIAIISLVDTDRIWFKSKYGINIEQIDLEPGLCASAILSNDLYLVENASMDPRTLANDLVAGEFGLRFYAAIPLKVRSGHNIGTLCVIDKHPRTLTQKEKDILKNLASILVDQIELRLAAREAFHQQTQMLSVAAHELKNPLTTILVWADLIKQEVYGNVKITSMCSSITNSSLKMTSLIDELLDTAKIQSHTIELKCKEIDLSIIVGRVASQNLILANKKNQTLYLDIQSNIPACVDETRMGEIVDNLLNNAIKYSGQGAVIMVRLKGEGKVAILEVIDEGPGFTKEDKLNLFLPFTRLSAKPTAGESSTGLGLSIVKRLVQLHHGSIAVEENAVGKGAKFTVTIPSLAADNI